MLKIATLSSGLTLIIEEMPQFESVAYELAIPGGIVWDKQDTIGASLILGELTTKGAGDLDSEALSNAFDECGIRHGEGGGHDRFSYRGQCAADHLKRALELVSLMVTKPRLPESEVDNIRSILLQEIDSLKDNPSRRAMLYLSERYFPEPYSRPSIGRAAGIQKAEISLLESAFREQFAAKGSVLSIAGKVSAPEVIELCEQVFSGFKGDAKPLPEFKEFPKHEKFHVPDDSAQLQIVLAYPSAKFGEKSYYPAKIASQILSGGMFGRLFIEVREKRGLCYSVYLRHSATQDYGMMQAYAGTTPERAHKTLEVMLSELKRLKGTVSEEELRRAKANLKSALIIGGESPASRSTSNAGEWWISRRVRTLPEIIAAVDAVSTRDIDELLEQYPCDSHMLVTLGNRDIHKAAEGATT